MDRKKRNRRNIRSVLNYIKKYIPVVIFSMLMAVVIVASNLYIPILIGKGVDLIAGAGRVGFAELGVILIKGAVAVLVGMAAQWLMNVCNNKVTYGVVRDIRRDAFEKLERLPLSYLDARPVGDLVSCVIADVDQFADGLLMGFTQFLTGVLTIILTLIIMLRLNLICTVVVFALTPVSFLVAGFIASHTFHMFLAQSETRGEQTAFIDEIFRGFRAVKACGRERDMALRFDEINDRLSDTSLKATFYSSLTNPSTRFVNSLVYASVAVTGAYLSMGGGITIGTLTSFLAYATQYMKPFNEISGVITELQNALTCAGRVFDLLERESEEDVEAAPERRAEIAELKGAAGTESIRGGLADPDNMMGAMPAPSNTTEEMPAPSKIPEGVPAPLKIPEGVPAPSKIPEGAPAPSKIPEGTPAPSNIPGRVELSHVAFSYVPEKELIRDLNLMVEAGKRIAIVGPTGCGKTTLINLLMRFYETDAGTISVDGRDIRSMQRRELRLRYGMVLQDTWIRTASVRDNILMGRKASDEEVVRAARSAYADGFIRRLPQGYDTVISEEGSGLSAGQKQLLCIARIMLSLPSMLILDEATSSIDTKTEQRIQRAFEKMMSGRTSFVVAHRLSTIKSADTILVMKDGDVIEKGNHRELMERDSFYKKLYMSQFATT